MKIEETIATLYTALDIIHAGLCNDMPNNPKLQRKALRKIADSALKQAEINMPELKKL